MNVIQKKVEAAIFISDKEDFRGKTLTRTERNIMIEESIHQEDNSNPKGIYICQKSCKTYETMGAWVAKLLSVCVQLRS